MSSEAMSQDTVTVGRRIAARPGAVFSFFTDRERWLSWMGVDGEFTFESGGPYHTNVTGADHASGRLLEIDPPKRLVFSWGWTEEGAPVPPGSSIVEITLDPDGEGTRLTLVHSGLPSAEACAAHAEGWEHYLDRLAVRAEGGDPGPDDWVRKPA
ncbi:MULTISPECIES: SRPBCC family protein [Streptomyces]|uniref:SRPBCC domain-containing protein n=1 Tax=Streptomyces chengmaiensis TaxID=3040919 RepID=A0ABT6HXZ5_9ACTN|nr:MULTISPECIES: SRPBCC domain-containing protein [Streptomyces]MDH2393581.1 SRPBCC domain-containing protein [Streptomyces chengmaiensis]WRQ79293.1 SRPBCC domain-containing protein [Streptomyces sp. MUM 178J]